MLKAQILLATLLATSACAVSVGGSGNMTNGAGVIGEMRPDATGITFTISSADGWTCQGRKNDGPADRPAQKTISLPLKCSDGRTGMSVVVLEAGPRFTMSFTLSNSERGTVIFAMRERQN